MDAADDAGVPGRAGSDPVHVVLMGVAGSGKTTLAELLVARTGWASAEADEFHPAANIEKMSAGHPLDDEDRWPWLRAIRDWLSERTDAGESAVVTCSALRRSYRDVLREARGGVWFAHLDGPRALLEERIGHRSGHFMKPEMLTSQLETLEPLDPDEDGVVLDVARPPQELADEVLARLAKEH
ncbi:gluconokinase [Cellulomonas sp. PhB143]|uniref:gluconokinase n=1 Tax=Cellulomonas sp. PhB143 TaxID=2485186 RepID=UPI000FB0029D|nr:gluconokinase [Cellulomonas sp. PhB143]ROS78636.1 gluconate kinase (SKI family) [Cellulomonas sp. PhB143]